MSYTVSIPYWRSVTSDMWCLRRTLTYCLHLFKIKRNKLHKENTTSNFPISIMLKLSKQSSANIYTTEKNKLFLSEQEQFRHAWDTRLCVKSCHKLSALWRLVSALITAALTYPSPSSIVCHSRWWMSPLTIHLSVTPFPACSTALSQCQRQKVSLICIALYYELLISKALR